GPPARCPQRYLELDRRRPHARHDPEGRPLRPAGCGRSGHPDDAQLAESIMRVSSRLCFAMPEDDPSSINRPRRGRIAQALGRVAAYGSAGLIVSGSIGQAIRDRSVGSALLMYIPLLPVGVAATVLDAAWKGRSLHRLRFGLTAMGLAAIIWSARSMMGS